jgi:putative Mn2+ efflux pump MntP
VFNIPYICSKKLLMSVFTIILLAVGLSFDTFAVSVSCGIARKKIVFWEAIRIASVFAFFQASMPLIGWALGLSVKHYIEPIDHWIALALLTIIGVKMIAEAFEKHDEKKNFNPLDLRIMITLAIATSIDALAVGISFIALDVNILYAYFIIGFITFLVAMLGMLFGKNIGGIIGKRMEIIGGLILIGIGVKIAIEHAM